ncbi:hypothetical protein HMPREF9123_2200 [Neisseria bacilliformis ATCC BAA-1200]|uniref:Uncharacterized protein n=1 Tax=Neisseria bacilliformis ATCC BAA-1200 TaxID=888742 RepID=F2BEP3_9NEIS|nr:hypothetical protein HMPREF9123_2200 [Neisseria bacilliformis ATCC BAA-1200]
MPPRLCGDDVSENVAAAQLKPENGFSDGLLFPTPESTCVAAAHALLQIV